MREQQHVGPRLVVSGGRRRYEIHLEEEEEEEGGGSSKKVTPEEVHTHVLKYMHGEKGKKHTQPKLLAWIY